MADNRLFMEEALKEAEKSLPYDIPVGAVVVKDGRIIARGHNTREQGGGPAGHAEMTALTEAAKATGDWRLTGCDMYVTLEPCPMCAGAVKAARLRALFFGAPDPEQGAAGSCLNLVSPQVKVFPGVLDTQARALLKSFFAGLRGDGQLRRIASFDVDHRYIVPGIYVSRKDGDVTTYDLRTRRPNCGDLMDNATMHSLEHMFATYVRNSAIGDRVIYFGPMGCQTGFYLLIRGENGGSPDDQEVLEVVKDTLRKTVDHQGEIFGKSEIECGNYRNLSAGLAKAEAQRFLDVLENSKVTFEYPVA